MRATLNRANSFLGEKQHRLAVLDLLDLAPRIWKLDP